MRIILLLVVLLCGCKMNEPLHPLMGDWLWQKTYSWGCFSSYQAVPKPGERAILRFSPSGRYQKMHNDTLKEAGTFRLESGSDPYESKKVLKLVFEPDPAYQKQNVLLSWSQNIMELDNKKLSYGYTMGTSSGGSVYVRE